MFIFEWETQRKRARSFWRYHILHTKYFIDGRVAWQRAVKNGELSFQSAWYVVPATSRVDHGGQKLDIDDVSEVTRFLQVIETSHLHKLTNDLIGYLKYTTITYDHLAKSHLVYHLQ